MDSFGSRRFISRSTSFCNLLSCSASARNVGATGHMHAPQSPVVKRVEPIAEYVCMYVYMYLFNYVCTYVCNVCMYVKCIYVCMYVIYLFIHSFVYSFMAIMTISLCVCHVTHVCVMCVCVSELWVNWSGVVSALGKW